MNRMKYRGYSAVVDYDASDRIFVGHISGIRDNVGFHGSTVDELETAFHDAVDHYLEVCEKSGQKPQKVYSGKLTLRVAPEIHAAVANAAEANRQSVNQWAAGVLNREATTTEGLLLGGATRVDKIQGRMGNGAPRAREQQEEVADLVRRFNNQQVDGRLFGKADMITLPKFEDVFLDREVDVFAKGASVNWLIEVKGGPNLSPQALEELVSKSTDFDDSTPWLVFFGGLRDEVRQSAKELGVMLTGSEEWQELVDLIKADIIAIPNSYVAPLERSQEFRRWVSQMPKTGVSLPDSAFDRGSIYD